MNKYKKDNLVVVIVLTLIFIISATLVYFIYFNKPDEVKKESIYVEVEDEDTVKKIENMIDEKNLYLLSKYEKNVDNMNSLTNSQKLEFAISSITKNVDFYLPKIEASLINKYFTDSFKSNIYWNKEDVKCSICKNNIYVYDQADNSFYINSNHDLTHTIFPIYSKVLDVKHKNDIYVVKVLYLWNKLETWNTSNNSTRYMDTAYATYMDVYNDNKLFKIDITQTNKNEENSNYFIKTELEENYEKYKNKLHTSIYTFEKENDNYKLISYRYE